VRERKIYLRRLAIFGPLGRIEETKLRFARHGTFGYEPIFLSHEDERLYPRPAQGDPVERRIRLLERERIAEVVVFESLEDGELLRRLVPRLLRTGLRVRYVSVGESQIRGGRRLDDFMGFTAVVMGGRPRAIGGWLKRITDLGLSALLLLVGLPLHLLQLLAVRRPVVVRRPLVGRRGGFFEMRSYRRLAGLLRYVPGLRYYPALLNVLSGQMSFVGLAPLTPDEWSLAEEGYQWNPPDAPAGILGPVRGVLDDDDEPVERICARNKEYVERWTPSGDLRIVLEVILERIGGKGRKA
jgi:lipopolysaccharide/colanic/teichoic acid biosynthesis glycosyltransferase